ncbi:MAG TPA: hypothetical protein VII13_16530 [Vicinamibacteria bacterium]|jgi:hypothetical protein
MRAARFVLLFLGAGSAAAAPQAPAPSPSPVPTAAPRGGLKLGPYGRGEQAPPVHDVLDLPRFESRVEVRAYVPPDPNETMQVWWRHYSLESSVYGRGYNIQTPVHPGSINILPLVEWIADKVKKKD